MADVPAELDAQQLTARSARQDARRKSFDAAAESYHRYRTGYPDTLFDALAAKMPPPARVLEIASGTGHATLPLATRGYQIRCVELGENLAAFAREQLRDFPNVQIEVGRFEDAKVEPDSVDMVVIASAFHWLEHKHAMPKIATALRKGGVLALLWTSHPQESRDLFAQAARPIYARLAPELLEERARGSAAARMSRAFPGVLLGDKSFTDCVQEEFLFSRTLDNEQFLGLLGTYSNFLTLGEETRARMFRELSQLLEEKFAGKLEREFRSVLQTCRRV